MKINRQLVNDRIREIRESAAKMHRYWQVEPNRVLTYARENLGDFDAYLAAIERYIQGKTQEA